MSFQFFLAVILAFLPVLGWLCFFLRKKNEKRTYVILTFLAGMSCFIPIKLYEQYWSSAIFNLENINLFQHLSQLVDLPSLPSFIAYVTVYVLVAVGFFVFVAGLMFLLEVISGDNTVKTFRMKVFRSLESPMLFIMIGFFVGVYSYLAARYNFSFSGVVYPLIVVGLMEEFIKHLVLRFADEFKIKSVDDAVAFSIIVALGFAFVENVYYFNQFFENQTQGIYLLIVMRSILSVLAHVSFSAIFGYYYGVSKLMPHTQACQIESKTTQVIHLLHQLCHGKGQVLFHEKKMFIGMSLAMGLHAVYNTLLEFEQIAFVFALISFLFFITLHLFHRYKFDILEGTGIRVEPVEIVTQKNQHWSFDSR